MARRRRRRVSAAEQVTAPGVEHVRPTTDRFADDTSMIGFRYIHSKYKRWFRLVWVVLLTVFIALTVYQVFDRVRYYWLNPVLVGIYRESPKSMPFPSVRVCSQVQMKASAVDRIDADVLRALSLLHDDDGAVDASRLNARLQRALTQTDFLNLSRAAQPTAQGTIVGCRFKQIGSCSVKTVQTPRGVCFVVGPNDANNISRPGPENTLSVLLNAESFELIPGFSDSTGIRVSLHLNGDEQLTHYSDGLLLTPGDVVSLPVNYINEIHRHSGDCGATELRSFTRAEYTQSACRWEKNYDGIQDKCNCTPVISPSFRDWHSDLQLVKKALKFPICGAFNEFRCVQSQLDGETADNDDCPDDCVSASVSSVLYTKPMSLNDYAHLLPNDWDERQQAMLADYRRAVDAIPRHRVPVLRQVQVLADALQGFVGALTDALALHPDAPATPARCSRDGDTRLLDTHMGQLLTREPLWAQLERFLDNFLAEQLAAVGRLLDSRVLPRRPPDTDESEETRVQTALGELAAVDAALLRPERVDGLRLMAAAPRAAAADAIRLTLSSVQPCIFNIASGTPSEPCRTVLDDGLRFLKDSGELRRALAATLLADDYEQLAGTIDSAVRKATVVDNLWLLSARNHNFDLETFATLHRINGPEILKLQELLDIRGIVTKDIVSVLSELINSVEPALSLRTDLIEKLQLTPNSQADASAQILQTAVDCFKSIKPVMAELKSNLFVRQEWTPRLQAVSQLAASFSPGPDFDKANLLLLKVYYTQLSRDLIVQRRSYNVFVLLSEIGGTLGLYVGAAVLTLLEVAVFFVERRLRGTSPGTPVTITTPVSQKELV